MRKAPVVTPVTREVENDSMEDEEEKLTKEKIEALTHHPSDTNEEVTSMNQAEGSDELVQKSVRGPKEEPRPTSLQARPA